MTSEQTEVVIRCNAKAAQDEIAATTRKATELRDRLKEATLKGDEKGAEKISRQLKRVDRELAAMRTNASNVRAAMKNLDEATPRELARTIKMINAELNSGRVRRGSAEWQTYTEYLRQAQGELARLNAEMRNTPTAGPDRLKTAVMGITAAIGGAVIAWNKLNSMMQDANAKEEAQASLKSLTGLEDNDIQWLTEQAEKLSTTMDETGLRVTQTSEEILKAYMMVGSAKPELLSNKEALNSVTVEAMRLAKASGMELEPAVTAMTTALNQYNAGAEKAAEFVNILAAGSQKGSADVEKQAAAVLKAGVAAAGANVQMNELTGCIETLAGKAIVGEVAGTGLKKFFLTLQTGAKETNPKVVGLTQALANLKAQVDAAEAKSAGGGAAFLKKMFGEEGYNIAAVLTEDIAKVREYTDAVTDTQIAVEQAANNSDTRAAKMAQANNQIHEAGIALMEQLSPAILKMTQYTASAVGRISSMISFLIKHRTAVIALTGAILTYIAASKSATIAAKAEAAAEAITNGLLKTKQILLTTCTAAMNLFKAGALALTGNLAGARAAMAAFNATCAANPLGMVIAVLGTAVTAIMTFKSATEDSEAAVASEAEAMGEAARKRAEAESQMRQDIDTIKEFNGTKEEETQLLSELNDRYGDTFGRYKTLKAWYAILTEYGDEYTRCVRDMTMAEAKREAALEYFKHADKLRKEAEDGDMNFLDKFLDFYGKYTGSVGALIAFEARGNKAGGVARYRQERLAQADEEVNKGNELMDEWEADTKKINAHMAAVKREVEKKHGIDAQNDDPVTPVASSAAASSTDKKKGKGKTKTGKQTAPKPTDEQAQAVLDSDRVKRYRKMIDEEQDLNTAEYERGEKKYLDYITRRSDLTRLMMAEEIDALKKGGMEKSDLYKKKERELEKWDEDALDRTRKYNELEAEEERKGAVAKAEAEFNDPKSDDFQDDAKRKEKLLDAEKLFITRKMNLYKKGSDEYIALQREMDEAEAAARVEKEQALVERLLQIKSVFADKGAEIERDTALKLTDELKDRKLITEEEYQIAVAKIRKDYEEKSGAQTAAFSGTQFTDRVSELEKKRNLLKQDLDAEKQRFQAGIITQEEYHRRVSQLNRQFLDETRGAVAEISSSYSDMLTSLYDAFDRMFNHFDWSNFKEDLAGCVIAAVEVMSWGLSQYSGLADAQRDLEIAKIEKRYEAEIQAAGKNQKKTKQLEEKKQKEVAAVKKKYNDRAMKIEIAQAVAQTAVAAINAYASASKVSWVLGPIAAAMATAAGAIQIATIKKQHEAESAGYYEGGFTSRDNDYHKPVGVVHAGEFVANHKAVASPVISPLLHLIDHAQRTNTVGSLTAEDVSAALGAARPASWRAAATPSDRTLTPALRDLAAVSAANARAIADLRAAIDNGIDAYVVMDGEQGLYRKMQKYDKLINSHKR